VFVFLPRGSGGCYYTAAYSMLKRNIY
jgi:hypothetical protein